MSASSRVSHSAVVRLLRLEQVLERTSLSRTRTYELIAQGKHPAPVKLGRSSRWVESEVDAFVRDLIERGGL